jgi:hypothetical protein
MCFRVFDRKASLSFCMLISLFNLEIEENTFPKSSVNFYRAVRRQIPDNNYVLLKIKSVCWRRFKRREEEGNGGGKRIEG